MLEKELYILAIESSCDDTSVAILCNNKILANITANQSIHEQYGGVVPELASRDHQKNILPVVDVAIKKSGIGLKQLHAIAFTRGPGLMGSLLVGASFAKSLALGLNIPLIEVNHMRGHILAHFIDEGKALPEFPFLCLTVSGGHTQIVKITDYLKFELIGETTDDAVGEAFDKAAKILGLPYPGGPLIDKYAQLGNSKVYQFPKQNIPDYNYSFSGLKTAFMNFVNKETQKNPNFVKENLNDISASYQSHIVSELMKKLQKAVDDLKIKQIAIAGGVSANSGLRKAIEEFGLKNNCKTFIPKFEYCTDNAAMIGIVAYYKYLNGEFSKLNVVPTARYEI